MQYLGDQAASLLQEQVQQHHQLHGQTRRKLTQEANALEIQEQELDLYRRQPIPNANATSGQTQQQEHTQKNPAYDVSDSLSPVQGCEEELQILALLQARWQHQKRNPRHDRRSKVPISQKIEFDKRKPKEG